MLKAELKNKMESLFDSNTVSGIIDVIPEKDFEYKMFRNFESFKIYLNSLRNDVDLLDMYVYQLRGSLKYFPVESKSKSIVIYVSLNKVKFKLEECNHILIFKEDIGGF